MKRYVVSEERNGSLVLCGLDGQQLRRHVSQTKKVQEWRVQKPANKQESKPASNPDVLPDDDRCQRPTRERRAPSYLSEYLRTVNQDTCDLDIEKGK